MNALKKINQDVLTGSSLLKDHFSDDRLNYFLANIESNKCIQYYIDKYPDLTHSQINDLVKNKFLNYRLNWNSQPKEIISNNINSMNLVEKEYLPLCVDIEIASICDLACPHCYRESIVTPDKIIDEKLFYTLIDQIAELGVPSVKLNWRGEPLLHPKVAQFIRYAKDNGIIEVIINTNATQLTATLSQELIEAGLDYLIYSFDGGTKATYEKMRPSRFNSNTFESVYANIQNFSMIRNNLGSKFPRTKIQMILTEETFLEQEEFFNIFRDYVDDVSVTQYTERGANFEDLSHDQYEKYAVLLKKYSLSEGAPYLRDAHGSVKISTNRVPCYQPFQRLMITYDGRVSMCCYDWGAMHPIGYVSEDAFTNSDRAYKEVALKIKEGRRGFELMSKAKMPQKFNSPNKVVSSIIELWSGSEIEKVRKFHRNGDINQVEICRNCKFKDTYDWKD